MDSSPILVYNVPMMRNNKAARLATLTGLLIAMLVMFNQHRQVRGYSTMTSVLNQTVADLNSRGRLPLNGYVGGMANNLWQSFTGHARELGCGGQAEVLYTRLEGHVPGWKFELVYEYGVRSPILLPHQWVEAYGPNGQQVTLDPWAANVEAQ